MKKIIYNSSMPRSGSELLQVLLSQNPDIYASPTSPLLEYQYGMRGNSGLTEVVAQPQQLMNEALLSACEGLAQGYYKPITDKPIVCDKNRGWAANYRWVNSWNPDAKMIVMVRDLRGIVASMERVYRKNTQTQECANLPLQMDRRIGNWLDTEQVSSAGNPNIGSPPIGLALNRVRGLFQEGLNEKVLFVKYEDLCSSPSETMNRVYSYLQLDNYNHDFNNIKKAVDENASLFGAFGNHDVKPRLSQPSKWDDVLPDNISDLIKQNNSWYFDLLGY